MYITYKHKKRKRQKTHGFLKRASNESGKKITKQRRRKNRKIIAV